MDPGSFFTELKRRNVYKVAVAYAVMAWPLIKISAETSASLVGRSNEELLGIIRGGATSRAPATEIEPLALPPNFWSMPTRDAALALVLENSSEETRRRVAFSIAEPANAQPPEQGEVGIRWDAPGSGPMGFGAMRITGEGIWGWPPDRENAKKVLRRSITSQEPMKTNRQARMTHRKPLTIAVLDLSAFYLRGGGRFSSSAFTVQSMHRKRLTIARLASERFDLRSGRRFLPVCIYHSINAS